MIVLNLRGKFRNSKLNFWEDVPTLKIHQDIKGFLKIIESPSCRHFAEENFIIDKCLVKIHLSRDAKNGQFLKKIEKLFYYFLLISI
jgi:hypothetical protein